MGILKHSKTWDHGVIPSSPHEAHRHAQVQSGQSASSLLFFLVIHFLILVLCILHLVQEYWVQDLWLFSSLPCPAPLVSTRFLGWPEVSFASLLVYRFQCHRLLAVKQRAPDILGWIPKPSLVCFQVNESFSIDASKMYDRSIRLSFLLELGAFIWTWVWLSLKSYVDGCQYWLPCHCKSFHGH